MNYWMGKANGSGLSPCQEILDGYFNHDAMSECGVISKDEIVGKKKYSSMTLNHPEVGWQDYLCGRMHRIIFAVLHHKLLHECCYMFGYPHKLALFAGDLASPEVDALVNEIRMSKDALEKAEKMAKDSKWWKQLVSRSSFSWCLVRDVS